MIGKTLSHYTVLEELSRGELQIVYRARDEKLNREVALKILPPNLVQEPPRRERFVQADLLTAELNVFLRDDTDRCRNLFDSFVHSRCTNNDFIQSCGIGILSYWFGGHAAASSKRYRYYKGESSPCRILAISLHFLILSMGHAAYRI